MKEFKDFENEELMNELNEAVEQAVTKTQAAKGEITSLVLMNLPNIYEMAMNGATTSDICKALGIQVRTFNKIKSTNKQLQAVLKQAEIDMTDRVKQSLFHMTQARVVKAQKVLSNGSIIEYETLVQPDPSLIRYFLNNRDPENWKDKQEVTVTRREFVIDIVEDDSMVHDVEFTVSEEEKDTENNK